MSQEAKERRYFMTTWTTTPTTPGAYLWRREGSATNFADVIRSAGSLRGRVYLLHDSYRDVSEIGGEWLLIAAILDENAALAAGIKLAEASLAKQGERLAELERRVAAMEKPIEFTLGSTPQLPEGKPQIRTVPVESWAKHELQIRVNDEWQYFHCDYMARLKPMMKMLVDVFGAVVDGEELKPASGKCKSGAEWRERHEKEPSYDPAQGYIWHLGDGGTFSVGDWIGRHFRNYTGSFSVSRTLEAANAALDAALLACGEIEPEPEHVPQWPIESPVAEQARANLDKWYREHHAKKEVLEEENGRLVLENAALRERIEAILNRGQS